MSVVITMNLPVDKLQPNNFNPNVMPSAEYEALKKDMQQVGPAGVGPILASPAKDFYREPLSDLTGYYVIIDGEHQRKRR
jgi:hypothetical protein